jgi:hypothetical protein
LMEDAGSGGWNGEPAWTGRTSGRDPQGSVPFQTRPSDRPFSSPVALPESYVLPVPWRAPPRRGSIMPRSCCARRPGWVGVAGSVPAHHQIVGSTAECETVRAAAGELLHRTAHPQRDRGGPVLCARRHRDLTTKCVVRCCDKSPTEPKHVRPVSSFTRVSTRGPTHG